MARDKFSNKDEAIREHGDFKSSSLSGDSPSADEKPSVEVNAEPAADKQSTSGAFAPKAEPDSKPASKDAPAPKSDPSTFEASETRPIDPKPTVPVFNGPMQFIDVQAALSERYPHHDIRYDDVFEVAVPGGVILIDIAKVNKCKNRAELAEYIDGLMVQ